MLLQSYLIGVFVTLSSWFGIYSWKRRRLYHMANRIPGPRGFPFLGEALSVLGGDHRKAFRSLTSLAKDYLTPSRIWYGPYCAIILDKAEDLQVVLNSQMCLDKSEVYKYVGLEKGLVVADNDLWRKHRKILDPAFNVNVLQSFMPIFNRKSEILIEQLEKRVGKSEANIFLQIAGCTLETLLSTMMGLDKDIQSNVENNKYLHDFENGSKVMNDRLFKVWLHIKPIFKLSSLYPLYKKHLENGMYAIGRDILKDVEAKKSSSNSLPTKHKIFIEQLLSAKDQLQDDEVIDEINTLIAAGHETSSLILSAALLMLAMHQDVQERAFDEVKRVMLQLNGGDITEKDLHSLTYLEMVIKETMRLFPVLPIHGRLAKDDIKLEKYTIPRGANIVISVFNAHRNPKNWGSDAGEFIPERFLPENFAKIHPYSFIPFSKGPRICIGWRYSILFMKTTLFHLLKNFSFSTTLKYKELDYEIALTMKIVQKYMVSLRRRE